LIVVDASIALAWCLPDETSEYAYGVLDRLVNEAAAAPAHWPLEVANALINAERRGRLDPEAVMDASRLLDRLGIEIVVVELTTATWGIVETAREHNLSVYDAAYLDLARFKGASLATLDDSLKRACVAAGVALVS
jgi:predicted nucleic acid-binding protein